MEEFRRYRQKENPTLSIVNFSDFGFFLCQMTEIFSQISSEHYNLKEFI
jgi:hypothetical protein